MWQMTGYFLCHYHIVKATTLVWLLITNNSSKTTHFCDTVQNGVQNYKSSLIICRMVYNKQINWSPGWNINQYELPKEQIPSRFSHFKVKSFIFRYTSFIMFAGGRKKKFVNQPHQPNYTRSSKHISTFPYIAVSLLFGAMPSLESVMALLHGHKVYLLIILRTSFTDPPPHGGLIACLSECIFFSIFTFEPHGSDYNVGLQRQISIYTVYRIF